jgi:hypothetical protein
MYSMGKTIKTITVSTSMALVATSAMASVGQSERVEVKRDYALPEGLAGQIDAALGKRSVRDAVNAAFFTLINAYGEDGVVLDEKYFGGKYGEMMREGTLLAQCTPGATDSTCNSDGSSGGVCYSNCYGNCHSACHGACHGSRGWR